MITSASAQVSCAHGPIQISDALATPATTAASVATVPIFQFQHLAWDPLSPFVAAPCSVCNLVHTPYEFLAWLVFALAKVIIFFGLSLRTSPWFGRLAPCILQRRATNIQKILLEESPAISHLQRTLWIIS